jgi:hypothetical protein
VTRTRQLTLIATKVMSYPLVATLLGIEKIADYLRSSGY